MTVITVSQVNTYIKALLDESQPLKNIYIVGEISNFLHYFRSGHMYFTLKDEKSQIKAVMFSSYADKLKFKLEDGMRVICRGRISVYEKDGAYQLYVEDIQPDGIGALNIAFEQLKKKLGEQGLFDEIYKKPIPKYPVKIGVATSDMGAAIEDIKNVTKRRYPLAELVIVPTIVQGDTAPADIVKSIRLLDSIGDIDVIILGRGGGSIEDLWAFNTEEVARAVFDCNTPVISAVGHETDFTICDFVSDLRAPTPSAGAELAVPDINAIDNFLYSSQKMLASLLWRRVEQEYQRLDYITNESVLSAPADFIEYHKDNLSSLSVDLKVSFEDIINEKKMSISSIADKLNLLSPLSTIARGFSVTRKNDKLVREIGELEKNDKITVDLLNGKAVCTVDEVIKNG